MDLVEELLDFKIAAFLKIRIYYWPTVSIMFSADATSRNLRCSSEIYLPCEEHIEESDHLRLPKEQNCADTQMK